MNELPEQPKPPRYNQAPPPIIRPLGVQPPPKRPSSANRTIRIVIWVIFGTVLLIRFAWWRGEEHRPFPRQVFWRQNQDRFRREPTPVQAPEAQVPNDLLRLHIDIAPRDEDRLRGYFWNGWRGQSPDRPEVQVNVREGGTVYTNVALHLKGAAGSFRPYDDKPALTLNFAKHAKKQRFHGYSKLSLNNSVQDPSFLCEVLSRELFDAAGVPVPKADFATVVINGRDLGLYVMVEGYNKDFLRRYFTNVKGNLYDGGFCQDVNPGLAVNSGDHPEDKSDIDRLLAAAHESSAARRWDRLTRILDVDRFISMLAMEALLCHWDGYGMNRNNYRLYHDLDADRMIFMPHGLDQMFGYPVHRFSTDSSIQPKMNGFIARAVLTTPEGGRRYFERLGILRTNVLKDEALLERVRQLSEHIRPTLAAYTPQFAQWHDSAVASLTERITRRLESVDEQLRTPREPIEFGSDGTVHLGKWNQPFAPPGMRMDIMEEGGAQLLHIAALHRGGTASWRTRVLLPNGRYRFEGRARASENAVGSRLSFRISGGRSAGVTVRGPEWVSLSFPFETEEFISEVILVCEFRATRGEAWFDVESLRLVRE